MSDGKRMNFVIFMPDEMRADATGCYGHPLVQTPNLDALAASGTRFDQCYIQHPVCSPSRCSMMTGWYPHVAGHRTLWHLLRPHEPNLLKYLKQTGYDVRWYGKNDLLAPGSFATSVTEALKPAARRTSHRLAAGPEDPLYDSFLNGPIPGGPWDTGDGASVAKGLEFLRSPHDRPFMLYLPLSHPHPPYTSPPPWYDMYAPRDVPALRPPDLPGRPSFHRLIRQTRRLDHLDEQAFRRIAAVYLGMISYSDFLLGELLKVLDQTGLAENTCVIFTADHGDWAGEFGLVEKWASALDDTIARVPLVIRCPGAKAGHVVDSPVELFDIMPTVLELADLEARHTHFARSLRPQLGGLPGQADRAAFAEGGYDVHEPHCFEGRQGPTWPSRDPSFIYYQKGLLQQTHPHSTCRTVMIRTACHKLVYRTADACELYDMRADPQETNNLYGKGQVAKLQQELELQLLHFYTRTCDVTPWDEDPRGLPPGGFTDSAC